MLGKESESGEGGLQGRSARPDSLRDDDEAAALARGADQLGSDGSESCESGGVDLDAVEAAMGEAIHAMLGDAEVIEALEGVPSDALMEAGHGDLNRRERKSIDAGAMRREHSMHGRSDATVQEFAAALLSQEEMAELRSAQGCVRHLRNALSLLREPPSEASVADRRRAAVVLAAGAVSVYARETIVELEGAKILVAAIQVEPDWATLSLCVSTLRQLALCDKLAGTFCAELAEKEIAGPLVALLTSPELPEQIRIEAAECATKLCETEPSCSRLIEAQIIPAAKAVIEQDPSAEGDGAASVSPSLVYAAITILRTLSAASKNRRHVIDCDILFTLLRLARAPGTASAGPTKQVHQEIQVQALNVMQSLTAQADFKAQLEEEGSIFALLFTLRDSSNDEVRACADAIAFHWDEEFFGWCWRCCSSCKSVTEMLLLQPKKELDAAFSLNTRSRAGESRFADARSMLSREAAVPASNVPFSALSGDVSGSPEDAEAIDPNSKRSFFAESQRIQVRLHEYLSQADEYIKDLLRLRARLNNGNDNCTRWLRQYRATLSTRQAFAMVNKPGSIAATCRDLSHALQNSEQTAQVACRQLLFHGNQLLDAKEKVHVAQTRLDEVAAFVEAGTAVEVMQHWRMQAYDELRKGIIHLAARLEVNVRDLVQQRLAGGRELFAKADGLLAEVPKLGVEFASLIGEDWMESTSDLGALSVKSLERGLAQEKSEAGRSDSDKSAAASEIGSARDGGSKVGSVRAQPQKSTVGAPSARSPEKIREPGCALHDARGVEGSQADWPSASAITSTSQVSIASCPRPQQVRTWGIPRATGYVRPLSRTPVRRHLMGLREEEACSENENNIAAEELYSLATDLREGLGSTLKLKRLKSIFNSIDSDGNGHVETKELSLMLRSSGVDVPEQDLEDFVSEIDLDGNGTLEFVEFLELLHKLSSRVRELLRKRAETGECDVPTGPLLESMLADSRRAQAKLPYCPAMERARREAIRRANSPRRILNAPRRMTPDPLSSVRTIPFQDNRSILQCHKSPLGQKFTSQTAYAAALILEAFVEAAPSNEDASLQLSLLYRQHAWAKLFSANSDMLAISGSMWQNTFNSWVQRKPQAQVINFYKSPQVNGVRRVHPSQRLQSLHGWDVMQLLSLFNVSNLLDVPWADDKTLQAFPLKQLWPSLTTEYGTQKTAARLRLSTSAAGLHSENFARGESMSCRISTGGVRSSLQPRSPTPQIIPKPRSRSTHGFREKHALSQSLPIFRMPS